MVESLSREQQTEAKYDSFLKTALGREMTSFFRYMTRLEKNRILFSEMSDTETAALEDENAKRAYNSVDSEFQVLQYSVAVQNELIYDALSKIDQQARNIILMSFWLDMSDLEISDETGIPRSTFNAIKRRTYGKLKELLEGKGYDANRFFPKGGA